MTAVTPAAVREHVLRQVAQPLAARGLTPADVPEDFDLLGEGVVDSFGLLEIINGVESHFRISVDFENLEAEDITVIGPFSRYVAEYAEGADGMPELGVAEPRAATSVAPAPAPPRPNPLRQALGRATVGGYRLYRRAVGKGFSLAGGGAFASFGAHSIVQPPIRLSGEHRIAIGRGVYVAAGAWLQVLDGYGERDVVIELGDYVSIAGNCVLSAVSSLRLGRSVSLAPGVYVADHAHAYRDPSRPISDQGITDIAPVEICDGAWLGANVVVLPGVRIGEGAVVAANSVVTRDVPDHALVAGAPARVVTRFG